MSTLRPPSSSLIRSLCLPTSRTSCQSFNPSQVLRTRTSITKRSLSTTIRHRLPPSSPPSTTSRGPPSNETTQTDFNAMDVLGNTPPPTTAIDACLSDGFHLNNGVKIGGGSGCLLVGGEAFGWRPWEAMVQGREGKRGMVNTKGQWDVGDGAWGVLEVVWPKPGLGPNMLPISPQTRRYINSLGIRVDVQDTRNAAAQFNLLATERGVQEVAAAMVPIGWREPKS
ncbi:MAG: hypothetical protein Q9176_007777 [Flavoplaca citrina]